MECGAEDLLCQIIEIVRENDYASGVLAKWLGELGDRTTGILGAIAAVLKDHGEKLVGLAGFSFGLYRWWKYREHILHKRLEEYLKENDRRLETGTQDLLAALQRPAPGQLAKMPLFAPRELTSVLRERNWDRTPMTASVHSSAQWQLSSAIEKIERQLKAGEDMIAALRNQLATAHVLRGAVAASSGARTSREDENLNALTAFRTALQVPGHEQNLVSKELEAHQLRRLGRIDDALQCYADLEGLAATIKDHRTQRLTIARAKRYVAELEQAKRIQAHQNGIIPTDASTAVFQLLRDAARVRSPFAPFQDWELLEQGDLHYLTALVVAKLGFVKVETTELDDAEACYQAISHKRSKRLVERRTNRKLKAVAREGVARVKRAREGSYDSRWLLSD